MKFEQQPEENFNFEKLSNPILNLNNNLPVLMQPTIKLSENSQIDYLDESSEKILQKNFNTFMKFSIPQQF